MRGKGIGFDISFEVKYEPEAISSIQLGLRVDEQLATAEAEVNDAGYSQ